MKSYSELINLYEELTNNTETANTTLGKELINDGIRLCHSKMPSDWWFLEDSITETTVASQQAYNLRHNFEKVITVTVLVGTTSYTLKEVTSQNQWEQLNQTSYSSDTASHFRIFNKQIELYPIPSSSGNTITVFMKKKVKNIGQADYTTGTITATNGSATITGSGTTFTSGMVGRFLKVDDDGEWYEIDSFSSTTSITLKTKYQGTTVSGASYTIGEMPALPENFHMLPVYYAVSIYYSTKNTQTDKFSIYDSLWVEGKEDMKLDNRSRSNSLIVSDTSTPLENPNLFVQL